MRYNKIREMDISDGEGVRVSLFVQGCEFHCKNCFNPETWNFEGGKEFTTETLNTLLKLCDKNYIKGLSILGGAKIVRDSYVGRGQNTCYYQKYNVVDAGSLFSHQYAQNILSAENEGRKLRKKR